MMGLAGGGAEIGSIIRTSAGSELHRLGASGVGFGQEKVLTLLRSPASDAARNPAAEYHRRQNPPPCGPRRYWLSAERCARLLRLPQEESHHQKAKTDEGSPDRNHMEKDNPAKHHPGLLLFDVGAAQSDSQPKTPEDAGKPGKGQRNAKGSKNIHASP